MSEAELDSSSTPQNFEVPGVDEKNPLDAPVVESSFATLFPKYREQYIRQVWGEVTRFLEKKGIKCELNLVEGSMSVFTTRKTWDPYAIIKARDLIKLLARSVPLPQAMRIFEDDVFCDIIKIGRVVRNKERFAKRRQRLIGPNGCTLKAIELLTQCYVLVQGNTVAVMGPWKGLKQVRKIVMDCLNNKHPIYNIKALMLKNELANDPKLKNEDWSRFLPEFKKKNVQTKKPKVVRQKKEYTPFPPAPVPSKIDQQLESGEYFLSETAKQQKKEEEKRAKAANAQEQRENKRAKEFVPPKEEGKKRNAPSKDSEINEDVERIKSKLRTKKSKTSSEPSDISSYLA